VSWFSLPPRRGWTLLRRRCAIPSPSEVSSCFGGRPPTRASAFQPDHRASTVVNSTPALLDAASLTGAEPVERSWFRSINRRTRHIRSLAPSAAVSIRVRESKATVVAVKARQRISAPFERVMRTSPRLFEPPSTAIGTRDGGTDGFATAISNLKSLLEPGARQAASSVVRAAKADPQSHPHGADANSKPPGARALPWEAGFVARSSR